MNDRESNTGIAMRLDRRENLNLGSALRSTKERIVVLQMQVSSHGGRNSHSKKDKSGPL